MEVEPAHSIAPLLQPLLQMTLRRNAIQKIVGQLPGAAVVVGLALTLIWLGLLIWLLLRIIRIM